MIEIGDIFEIPLSQGRKAYGQYVFFDKKMGSLIQIFDLFDQEHIEMDKFKNAKMLFPPFITGLFAAIKNGQWKIIGHLPVVNFVYPNFISCNYDEKTGKAIMWFLWNGETYIKIGSKLPNQYKKMEYLIGWSQQNVIRRIETREYPYPYFDLINKNEFTPKNLRVKD